jgi:hypothetical protein
LRKSDLKGHDFSRAENSRQNQGLQPLRELSWRLDRIYATSSQIFRRGELQGLASERGERLNSRANSDRRRAGLESFGLSPANLRTLRSLKTPAKIQKFIDALQYQYADTAGSPRRVLRERKGHCLEGALLAAAALRVNGHPPLLMDLEAVRDDDHVVALYRERGLWGGIAKSNYAGLRFRAPIYRTLRELALSYFEHYYNLRGERTLRAYAGPVNLERLDSRHWMTAEEDVRCVPEMLIQARHYALFPDPVARTLPRLDRRSFEAGMHGRVKH